MPSLFRRIVFPPVFASEEKNYSARLLNLILWFGLVTTGLAVLAAMINSGEDAGREFLVIGSVFLIFILCKIILQIGQVTWASLLLVYSLGAILTFSFLLTNAPISLSFSGYIVIILLAYSLLGWRTGLVTFLLSTLTSLFILVYKLSLQPAPQFFNISTSSDLITYWMIQTMIFGWIIFLVYLAHLNLNRSLQKISHDERQLRSSYQKQQATQETLTNHAQALERHIVDLQVAAQVARDATMLQEMDALLDNAVEMIRDRFGFYHAAIFLLDERKEFAVLRAAVGDAGRKMVADGHQLIVGQEGIVGRVAASGQSFLVPDVSQEAAYFQNPHLPETRSELALPLKTSGQIIGVLDVQSSKLSNFDADDVAVLQILADQLAVGIENARLYEAARRQLAELTTLHAIALAVSESSNEDDLIARATHLIADVFYPDNFGILLKATGQDHLVYHPSYHESQTISHDPVRFGEGIVGMVALQKTSWRITDTLQEPFYKQVDPLIRSELCVPLITQDRVIGIINAESTKPGFFSEDDERLLATLAGQLATGIEKIRLFQAERQRRTELEGLRQVSLQLASHLDLTKFLEGLLKQAVNMVSADNGEIFLYDGTTLTFGAAYSQSETPPPYAYPHPRPQGLTYSVARVGKRIVIPNTRTHALYSDHPWDGAIIGLPLRHGDQVLGVMNLAYHQGPHVFTQHELRLLEMLADQSSVALVNAQLFTQAQERAEQLAQSLQQLKELDHLKSEFIQNVSHELRTPLAITRGYIDLLESGEIGILSPPQADALGILSRRINMLIKLVDDLVIILEAEARDITREKINLGELVIKAIEDFQPQAGEAKVQLASEIDEHPPSVMGSPSHLNRLLDNLLSNAIKFTPPGGRVTVHLTQLGEDAVLEVIDTGCGIAHDKIDKIFDRFFQVDGSTQRRFGGIGLGLALVKEITEAHGGRIEVDSEVGMGSTFRIFIPALELGIP